MVHTAAELGVGALAAVVERSRDGIVVVTADRRYVYANPAACRIMGYSLDELRALPDFLDNFPRREHWTSPGSVDTVSLGSLSGR